MWPVPAFGLAECVQSHVSVVCSDDTSVECDTGFTGMRMGRMNWIWDRMSRSASRVNITSPSHVTRLLQRGVAQVLIVLSVKEPGENWQDERLVMMMSATIIVMVNCVNNNNNDACCEGIMDRALSCQLRGLQTVRRRYCLAWDALRMWRVTLVSQGILQLTYSSGVGGVCAIPSVRRCRRCCRRIYFCSFIMLLTKHRTLSGSCLVSAWLNAGEKLSADSKQQDGDGQLTQSEESARNLTEEVSFCMEFELTGVVLLLAVIPLRCYQPLYFSLLDSSIQVKATVRQQGFADFKGETITPTAFYSTAKKSQSQSLLSIYCGIFHARFCRRGRPCGSIGHRRR